MGNYKNPRVAVTCPQETYDTYKEYSDLIDIPLSKLVVSILQESEPMIKTLVETFKKSEGDKEKFLAEIQHSLLEKASEALDGVISLNDLKDSEK